MDEYGNVKKITNPDGSYKQFNYINNGKDLGSERDESNNYVFYRYDTKGNLTREPRQLLLEPINILMMETIRIL
jgi:hypothetical protein